MEKNILDLSRTNRCQSKQWIARILSLIFVLYLASITGCVSSKRLASIALEDNNPHARIYAVKMLNNQPLLMKVAMESDDRKVCMAAVWRLKDPAMLEKVASDGKNIMSRVTARRRLKDLALEAEKKQEARAVAAEKDQDTLANIVITHRFKEIREAAVKKLTDQNLLTKVALESDNRQVCKAAVEKLTDPSLLEKVALDAKNSSARYCAVRKVTNLTVLKMIALEDEKWSFCEVAVKKLTDQAVLKEIAMMAKCSYARYIAVGKLKDVDVLTDIALKDNDKEVRELAGKTLVPLVVGPENDQEKLAELVIYHPVWPVRKAAFRKIADDAVLDKLASQQTDVEVSLAAKIRTGKLSWKKVIERAIKSPPHSEVTIGAIALCPFNKEARTRVTALCLSYIGQGDIKRIPELIELLNLYGSKYLAEDYMNCGRHELKAAGSKWARKHGYKVRPGSGSSRKRWGEDR